MTEQEKLTVELTEDEAHTVCLALIELATRYQHMLDVCEFGEHENYAESYRQRLDEVNDLLTVFNNPEDEEDFEVDPKTGELK